MSETTQTKTSQTMDVSLKRNTKGNSQVRTTTIRMESRTVKVDPIAAFHTWAKRNDAFQRQQMNTPKNNKRQNNIQRGVSQQQATTHQQNYACSNQKKKMD